jgi:hypothetical protein
VWCNFPSSPTPIALSFLRTLRLQDSWFHKWSRQVALIRPLYPLCLSQGKTSSDSLETTNHIRLFIAIVANSRGSMLSYNGNHPQRFCYVPMRGFAFKNKVRIEWRFTRDNLYTSATSMRTCSNHKGIRNCFFAVVWRFKNLLGSFQGRIIFYQKPICL